MKKYCATALSLLCIIGAPAVADVTLTSNDGTIEISGELIRFENNQYTVKTVLGEVVIPADMMSCEGEDCPADKMNQNVRIATSDIFKATLLPSIIKQLADEKQARVEISGTSQQSQSKVIDNATNETVATIDSQNYTSSQAFDALFNGEADVIFTERRATNADIERFLAAGLGDLTSAEREVIFAQDAVVAVVSPENPIRSISIEQSEAIFSGRYTNWSELGGADLPIKLYAPQEDSAVSDYFTAAVLDQNFSSFASSVDRSLELPEIDVRVSQDPAAIGIISSAHVRTARPLALSSSCGIQTAGDSFDIRSEDYPMTRRLFAYTTNRSTPTFVKNMISALQSENGQSVVNQSGFTNLSAETSTLDGLGQQLAYSLASPEQAVELPNLRKFASEVLNAERLSMTFRFSSGSSQIDNKARADAVRLTELLKRPEYEGSEVLLIGFTDSIGKSVVNTVLSERRANQLRDEIVLASGNQLNADNIRTLGYGAAFPAACNDNDAGRQINRRVEVWIR